MKYLSRVKARESWTAFALKICLRLVESKHFKRFGLWSEVFGRLFMIAYLISVLEPQESASGWSLGKQLLGDDDHRRRRKGG